MQTKKRWVRICLIVSHFDCFNYSYHLDFEILNKGETIAPERNDVNINDQVPKTNEAAVGKILLTHIIFLIW